MNPVDIAEGTDQVLEDLGHTPTRYEDEITWRMPTAEEAAKLGMMAGTPVGRLLRTTLDQHDRAKYWGYSLLVVLYFGWFYYGFEPVVMASLSSLVVFYSSSKHPCRAARRTAIRRAAATTPMRVSRCSEPRRRSATNMATTSRCRSRGYGCPTRLARNS